MKFRPYEYQQTAIKWIIDNPRCGLFLDMGDWVRRLAP